MYNGATLRRYKGRLPFLFVSGTYQNFFIDILTQIVYILETSEKT